MRSNLCVMILVGALCGCGNSGTGKKDSRAKDTHVTEASISDQYIVPIVDRSLVDSSVKKEGGTAGDAASSTACDPTCIAESEELCLKDSGGTCVACLVDADCAKNPVAWGSKCDTSTNTCTCGSNSDCASNIWGTKCDTTDKWCLCSSSSECGASTFGSQCNTTEGYCECTADTHCTSNVFGPTCDTAFGSCSCSTTTTCPSGRTCTGDLGGFWTYCK
jgi:hypothetical protein